jgi:hypothetical protein
MSDIKLFKKLRLDPGVQILVINAPKEFSSHLKGIPHDTSPKGKKETYDYVQVFAQTQADLEKQIKAAYPYGKYDCIFWACYPKGTGKIKSDIKRETVWTAFVKVGMDTVTQVAIDETWSAMRGRPKEKVGK